MIQSTPTFNDEDATLDWWEFEFAASSDALRMQADAGALVRQMVASLRAVRASAAAVVPLSVASRATGYSADHLSRLVRSGRVTDYGRKHAPRVKLMELPKKAARLRVANNNRVSYDVQADARSLVSTRR